MSILDENMNEDFKIFGVEGTEECSRAFCTNFQIPEKLRYYVMRNDARKLSSSPMIVVSNRLPFVLKRDKTTGQLTRHSSAGGLVTALAPVVKENGGTWVGWPGVQMSPDDDIPEGDPNSPLAPEAMSCKQIRPVSVPQQLIEEFYNGCCNATFWPLLHSMPDRVIFSRDQWNSYEKANSLFAEETFRAIKYHKQLNPSETNPLVWIHDYQLMSVPSMLRSKLEESGTNCKIAFFLHIPFPPYDIFRLFPWDDEVLVGLLGCSLIGFHVELYADNFIECCQKRLGCVVDRDRRTIAHNGRIVTVRAFPIGIPFQQFERLARQAPPVNVDKKYKVVLGVDRLDYTKGIIGRVKAFEKLLEVYPEHIGNVILLQIAVPSRTDVQEYITLKDDLEREIGRVNGRFSTCSWSPIRYLYQFFSQDELCAFYRDSCVGLVTPIRDGMNLVAKEYVACQIGDPGVLVLSPFTGAGHTMNEALIVNPLEPYELADYIHRALTMPQEERESRMTALRRREKIYDVNHWLRTFLSAAQEVDNNNSIPLSELTMDDFDRWLSGYIEDTSKLALLLDYDGTLAPIAPHPDQAIFPLETKAVIQSLARMCDVYVAIISGRSVDNVKKMVGIDGITYAGNHGLDIIHPDNTKFMHPDQTKYADIIDDLIAEIERLACHDGSWIERKGVGMTFHYRSVPWEKRQHMIDIAKQIIHKFNYKACQAHCAIEARPPIKWDKGRAAVHVLRTTFGVDWSERVRVIYVGDDATDEDAMKALSGLALTFRVTNSTTGRTVATRRLHGTESVLAMLRWLELRRLGRRSLVRRSTSDSELKPRKKPGMAILPEEFKQLEQ